ncbi:MAG: DUF1737 domain-containing protein [Gammaproteobacteria bacterium]|nr:DUF1737 domain-containing protein [Gammaproteobacteria bacterium]
MIKYDVLFSYDGTDFAQAVSDRLNNGWTLVGGVSDGLLYSQAMTEET